MSQVHDIGPYYMQRLWYKSSNSPLTEITHTQETEYPYRFGMGRVFRLPLTRQALIIGRWMMKRDEEDALLLAVDGHYCDGEDSDGLVRQEEG